MRDEQLLNRFREDQAGPLPEAISPMNATSPPYSPTSQTSSQQTTSTPRELNLDEFLARHRANMANNDQSLSGIFSPIRGEQSVPAGTMYRPWNESELRAAAEETVASQGTTRATLGSSSRMDMTGPSVINETGHTSPPRGLRRSVTLDSIAEQVEQEAEPSRERNSL
jgi:hypothetical protein